MAYKRQCTFPGTWLVRRIGFEMDSPSHRLEPHGQFGSVTSAFQDGIIVEMQH